VSNDTARSRGSVAATPAAAQASGAQVGGWQYEFTP
jgi:hypothetical protein